MLQEARRSTAAWVVAAAMLALVVLSAGALPRETAMREKAFAGEPSTDGIQWIPFDPSAIERERAAGRPGLGGLSAGWCITCKGNAARVGGDGAGEGGLGKRALAQQAEAPWKRRNAFLIML